MKKLYFILLFCFVGLLGFSQDTLGLGGNDSIYGLKGTTFMGDSSIAHIWIKNTGDSSITPNKLITINIAVEDSIGLNIFQQDTLQLSLAPDDSIKHTMVLYYTQGNFKAGPNILVIWPSAAGTYTADTAKAIITLTTSGGNSVLEIDDSKQVSIFPNPTQDKLFISQPKGSTSIVHSIRIMDISGKEIKSYKKSNIISLGELQPGTYLIEILFNDNTSKVCRIIKE